MSDVVKIYRDGARYRVVVYDVAGRVVRNRLSPQFSRIADRWRWAFRQATQYAAWYESRFDGRLSACPPNVSSA